MVISTRSRFKVTILENWKTIAQDLRFLWRICSSCIFYNLNDKECNLFYLWSVIGADRVGAF